MRHRLLAWMDCPLAKRRASRDHATCSSKAVTKTRVRGTIALGSSTLLMVWLLGHAIAPTAVRAESGRRPNILLIVVDDQSPLDLQLYNPHSTLQTPNLDRLAARGMVFDGAYHMGSFAGAVCMPSRHMIISGRTLWHLPPAPRGGMTSPPQLEQQTLPAVFRRAGYATMRTCKMGNSYEAANKQFEVRRDATKRGGTAESGSPWHGDQVMEYLGEREQQRDQRPFLIYFGFSHPHDTRDGTPELLAKYGATNHTDAEHPPALDPRQPPLPDNYLPRHPFDTTDSGVRDEVAVSGVWTRRDEASIRNEIGRQNACSELIDQQIGRVLEKLTAIGELDNTYVLYTADHGMSIGRHGLMGKQNLYQHTWRVPLLVAGPGIAAAQRVEGNVYLLDLFATLCELAGIAAPETNEGLSFVPVLHGERPRMRDVMYGAYSGGGKPGMRTVRRGDWKLIEYEAPDREARATQLFNLAENPDELLREHASGNPMQINLADDPKFADQLLEMRQWLLEQMRAYDDPYRFSFQPQDDLPPVLDKPKKRRS